MTTENSLAIHCALGQLMAEATANPRLEPEVARARREFFGFDPADLDPLRQLAAESRFTEWYLLERESEVLGEVPLLSLFRGKVQSSEDESLLDSTVGVFLVEGVDQVVELRDLQDREVHEMDRPHMLDLSPADVVVGRLFTGDHGLVVPSPAVAVKPAGSDLASAFERDLASLELDRRLTQIEIEHLLFRRWKLEAQASERRVSVQQLVAELDQLLQTEGVEEPTAEQLSVALRDAANPSSVIGPLMDQLAFDTSIGLERVSRLMIELWNARAAERPQPSAPEAVPPAESEQPDEVAPGGLGATLAQRIEAGREKHEDMATVFEDVAEMLGEDLSDEDWTETDETARAEGVGPTAFEGDLEPLIQEFIWEEDCAGEREEEVLSQLLAQQRDLPVPSLQLEFLNSGDLLRLVLRFYLESTPAERCERVRGVFAVLDQFCRWAQRTQEYPLLEPLEECRREFVDELERLDRAGRMLSAVAHDPGPTPGLLRVLDVEPERLAVVPIEEDVPATVPSAGSERDLRGGDLLLAALQRDGAGAASLCGMVVVLPAAAEKLLG